MTNERALRASLKKLGIKWPGDGGYCIGTQVYLVGTRRVITLVKKLAEPDHYQTYGGEIYYEKHTAMGITQALTTPRGVTRVIAAEPSTLWQSIRRMIADYLIERGETPSILHISFDDLSNLVKDEPELVEKCLGLDISLVPRGQPISVDRRIRI